MVNGYVDISQVVYEACERLGISNSEAYELRFMKLALVAEKKIGTGLITSHKMNLIEPGSTYFRDGKSLIIPHDLVSHLCILNSEKCEFDRCDYNIFGKRIIFKEVQLKPIIITYIGVEFDVNDEPIISSNHEEAVISYLVYMENFTRYQSKKIPKYIFDDSRMWWQDRLGEARGDDAFPTSRQIEESSVPLYSVKMYLENGDVNCGSCSLDDLIITYEKMFKVHYGILSLDKTIETASDYNETILNPEIETTTIDLASGNFVLKVTTPGRFTIVLPYSSSFINSMKDSLGNDVFDGYFNIIQDSVKELTIYVAKEFLTAGDYQLTFGFSDDIEIPVITLIGDNPQNIQIGNIYNELGATAIDASEGDLSAKIIANSTFVDTNTIGSYNVAYNVSDSSGNKAEEVIRTVNVVNTTITLIGDNPQIIEVGNAYTESGATALNNLNVDVTASIVIDSTAVDINTIGSYKVTYNVSDINGNVAAEVIRTVTIIDTIII